MALDRYRRNPGAPRGRLAVERSPEASAIIKINLQTILHNNINWL
ncbi:MAG TPA: hypothetical protein VMF86_08825 [Stellaceae bacterium]|nr:hypothetical protein [Stellaceae bacterium]